MEKYLTVAETAEHLNTSELLVRRLIAERRIVFHHGARHEHVALSDAVAWLAAQRAWSHCALVMCAEPGGAHHDWAAEGETAAVFRSRSATHLRTLASSLPSP